MAEVPTRTTGVGETMTVEKQQGRRGQGVAHVSASTTPMEPNHHPGKGCSWAKPSTRRGPLRESSAPPGLAGPSLWAPRRCTPRGREPTRDWSPRAISDSTRRGGSGAGQCLGVPQGTGEEGRHSVHTGSCARRRALCTHRWLCPHSPPGQVLRGATRHSASPSSHEQAPGCSERIQSHDFLP